jgi:acetyltransferase
MGGEVTGVSYPFELEGCLVLPDRARIRVRALRRLEDRPIRELFDRLSIRTRYLRFLSPLSEMPEALVRQLASVDYRRHLALVAEYDGGSGRETIGLASFGAVDDERAELGLVVRDDWQGRRLGTELAVRLLDAAEARGFRRFIAHVAAGNAVIRRIIRNVGLVVSASASFGVSEVVFVRRRCG